MSRLKERYPKEVAPALKKEFGYSNVMAIPKIEKVVINMGLGEATSNAKIADIGADEIGTDHRPEGRGAPRDQVDRAVQAAPGDAGRRDGDAARRADVRVPRSPDHIALPRVRDFRGVSPKGFDGRGNFTLGLRDQLLFPEIDYMKVDKARGMNVSVVTTAKTDEEARKLLQLMGMPFRLRSRLRNQTGAEPSRIQGSRMATTAKIAKEAKTPKFKIRHRNRCQPVRPSACLHAEVRHVPPVLPQAGARRRRHRV